MSDLTHKIEHEDLLSLNGAYKDLQVDVEIYYKLKDSGYKNAPALVEEVSAKLKDLLEIEALDDQESVTEAIEQLGVNLQVYAQSGTYFNTCKNLGAKDSQLEGFVSFMQEIETRLFDKLDIDGMEVTDGE